MNANEEPFQGLETVLKIGKVPFQCIDLAFDILIYFFIFNRHTANKRLNIPPYLFLIDMSL